jgi:hypothetical protein
MLALVPALASPRALALALAWALALVVAAVLPGVLAPALAWVPVLVLVLVLSRALAPVAALPREGESPAELVPQPELIMLAEVELPKVADLSVGCSPFDP